MNTTINLPESLLRKARSYAEEHHTTLTAIVIEQLEAVTLFSNNDPLVLFSRGAITKNQAIKDLGLRDYAELLVAMGSADLPLPRLPQDEIEKQAATFASIWKRA